MTNIEVIICIASPFIAIMLIFLIVPWAIVFTHKMRDWSERYIDWVASFAEEKKKD